MLPSSLFSPGRRLSLPHDHLSPLLGPRTAAYPRLAPNLPFARDSFFVPPSHPVSSHRAGVAARGAPSIVMITSCLLLAHQYVHVGGPSGAWGEIPHLFCPAKSVRASTAATRRVSALNFKLGQWLFRLFGKVVVQCFKYTFFGSSFEIRRNVPAWIRISAELVFLQSNWLRPSVIRERQANLCFVTGVLLGGARHVPQGEQHGAGQDRRPSRGGGPAPVCSLPLSEFQDRAGSFLASRVPGCFALLFLGIT